MPRFPPLEPFATGHHSTPDGHELYWEQCGNPEGEPALYLHGGPGAGCTPGARRYFDPERFRVLLVDQRGAGRSRPLAEDPRHDLETNTTPHLLDDLEALRQRFGFERWRVLGVSWGSTLALAYAQAHPERVSRLVLALVTTTSASEVRWATETMGELFPEAWAALQASIAPTYRDLPLLEALSAMLASGDAELVERAALAWCAWEDTHVSLSPGHQPEPRFSDPAFRLRFARLVLHYWRHHAFLPEGALFDGMERLAGVPGTLIHGRHDISSPLRTAWELHRRWPGSELVVLEHTGHGDGVDFPAAVTRAANG